MRRLVLGVVANEFFDLGLGRMGGFGWAARELARSFADPSLGVDVVFLTGELLDSGDGQETVVHGRPLILRSPSAVRNARRVRTQHPDVLLLIDYRPNYRAVCWTLPRTPIIVWVRDPRPPEDVETVDSLRIPGAEHVQPKGTFQPSCRSLGTLARVGYWTGRRLLFAATCDSLRDKAARMLNASSAPFALLPNPVTPLPIPASAKSRRPVVAVLGRLDPYKRPWLAVELARRFPQVEFRFLGKAFHHGAGAWQPQDVPPNVHFLGHLDGAEKYRLLGSAWALLNTSIHEGLAVSFLEALACGTPIVACVNPDELVSRFGCFAGSFPGTGLAGLLALENALRELLEREDCRRQAGEDGRRFVEETHSRARFLTRFGELCGQVGAPLPNPLAHAAVSPV